VSSVLLTHLDVPSVCSLAATSRVWAQRLREDEEAWRAFAQATGITEPFPSDMGGWRGALQDAWCTRVGDCIEVVDTYEINSVARVMARVHDAEVGPVLLVHFEGWDDSWFMWIHRVHDRDKISALTPALPGIGSRGPYDEAQYLQRIRMAQTRIEAGFVWPVNAGSPTRGRFAWPYTQSRGSGRAAASPFRPRIVDLDAWRAAQEPRAFEHCAHLAQQAGRCEAQLRAATLSPTQAPAECAGGPGALAAESVQGARALSSPWSVGDRVEVMDHRGHWHRGSVAEVRTHLTGAQGWRPEARVQADDGWEQGSVGDWRDARAATIRALLAAASAAPQHDREAPPQSLLPGSPLQLAPLRGGEGGTHIAHEDEEDLAAMRDALPQLARGHVPGVSLPGGEDEAAPRGPWPAGAVVEARDYVGQWYCARVLREETRLVGGRATPIVLVHFEGWSANYDEWQDAQATSIRPRAGLASFGPRGPETAAEADGVHGDAGAEHQHQPIASSSSADPAPPPPPPPPRRARAQSADSAAGFVSAISAFFQRRWRHAQRQTTRLIDR